VSRFQEPDRSTSFLRPLILIVEPNPFMAEVERAILRAYDVRFVGPRDLVPTARATRPAAVICEILLRGTDGLQLCRELKSRPETRHIPVVLFSVLDAEEEAREAGADGFLLKPAERGALAAEIRRLTGWPPPDTVSSPGGGASS